MGEAILVGRSTGGGSSGGNYQLVTETIVANKTWLVPEAVGQSFTVRIFGGGGGASPFCDMNGYTDGSGGGGGYMNNGIFKLNKGTSIPITIGTGGSRGTSIRNNAVGTYNSYSGGTTSFGSYLSAAGGGGGKLYVINNFWYYTIGGSGGRQGHGGNGAQFGGGGGGNRPFTPEPDTNLNGGNGGTWGGGGGSINYFGRGGTYGGNGGNTNSNAKNGTNTIGMHGDDLIEGIGARGYRYSAVQLNLGDYFLCGGGGYGKYGKGGDSYESYYADNHYSGGGGGAYGPGGDVHTDPAYGGGGFLDKNGATVSALSNISKKYK